MEKTVYVVDELSADVKRKDAVGKTVIDILNSLDGDEWPDTLIITTNKEAAEKVFKDYKDSLSWDYHDKILTINYARITPYVLDLDKADPEDYAEIIALDGTADPKMYPVLSEQISDLMERWDSDIDHDFCDIVIKK